MDVFEKISAITDSDLVNEGADLPKVYLHKWLVLGQTEHVCRYGTLSDGHEKITPSQRYAQAIKEMYHIALNMRDQRAVAMEAKADLMEAREALETAKTEAEKLRSQAKLQRAETRLMSALVTIEDQQRMLRTYDSVRKELGPEVEAMYPEGIEQAEPANWQAVAEYRSIKERVPGVAKERLDNIPLDPVHKAKLGVHLGRLDAIAPLMVTHREALGQIEESKQSFLDFIEKVENPNDPSRSLT